MNPEEIIRKKKVNMNLLASCIGKDGYLVYNAFFTGKNKRQLTKDEYMILKGYKRP